MIKKINLKSDFIKSVAVLMTGTMAAQMLGYVFAPIITRYYSPEESGELDLFIQMVALGAAFATARYELTLPVAKAHVHSFRLYHIAIRITVLVTIISFLILLYPVFTNGASVDYLFYGLVPVALLLTASSNMGTYWAIRMKLFSSISFTKVATSISSNLVKVGLGIIGWGYMGLILGNIAGLIFGNIWFVRNFFRGQKEFKIRSRSPRNFVLAKQYIEFPKVNLPHVVLDLGKGLLVAVFIMHFYGKGAFGLYGLSFRMLLMPIMLMGQSIGQVFFQKCSEKFNAKEAITPFIRKTMLTLFLLSIVPFTLIFFFGSDIFAFVFSEDWREAGIYSEIMAPWFVMIFVVSPVSSLPLIINRQREFFTLAILGTSLMIAAISIPPYFFDATIIQTLWVLSLSQAAYFVFSIFKIFEFVRKADIH
jgi:teichuronic acid exporter